MANNSQLPPHLRRSAPVAVHRLNEIERILLTDISERARLNADMMAQQLKRAGKINDVIELDAQVVFADCCVAHLCRDMDLGAWHRASDHPFMLDFIEIQKTINRDLCIVPDWVTLRFARKGSRIIPQ